MSAVPLHTRAVCDNCEEQATVEIGGGFFLCEDCAETLLDSVPVAARCAPGSFPRITKGDCPGTEAPALSLRYSTSADLDSALSGNPSACSSEREDVGATNSELAEAQSIEDSDGAQHLPARSLGTRGKKDQAPLSDTPALNPPPTSLAPALAASSSDPVDDGEAALSSCIDAQIAELEARWLAVTDEPFFIVRNADTFRRAALSETSENFCHVSAPSSSVISNPNP